MRETLVNNNVYVFKGRPYIRFIGDKVYFSLVVTAEEELDNLLADRIRCYELVRDKLRKPVKKLPDLYNITHHKGERVKIGLIMPEKSVAWEDIKVGLGEDIRYFDIKKYHVSFHNSQALAEVIEEVDSKGYDLFAIARGGGASEDLGKLDQSDIVAALVKAKTPYIAAVGHYIDKLFIKDVSDISCSVPNDLGHRLSKLVNKEPTGADIEYKNKRQTEELEKLKSENEKQEQKCIQLDKEVCILMNERAEYISQLNYKDEQIQELSKYKFENNQPAGLFVKMPVPVQWAILILAAYALLTIIS